MSLSKPFITITSLAVAAMFGGGVYFMMNLGSIAQQVTQRMATEALGVPVTIQKMDVSLQNKNVTVQGLRIKNPPYFDKPYVMTVDKVDVTLDSIADGLITFKKIDVIGTDVNVEVTQNGTNLHAIRKGMLNQPKETSPADETAEPIRVIIKDFVLASAQLNPSVTLVGSEDLGTVTVPDIRLSGIGQKQNGILAREAIAQIWTDVSKIFGAAAADAGFYQGLSADTLKEMGISQLDGLKTKITEGLNKGIKSLFGN